MTASDRPPRQADPSDRRVGRRRLLGAVAAGLTAVAGCVDSEEAVVRPDSFVVTELTVQPRTVEVGQAVTITAEFRNEGDITGTRTVEVFVDGKSVGTMGIPPLDPDVTTRKSLRIRPEQAGEHEVRVLDATATFEVRAPEAGN